MVARVAAHGAHAHEPAKFTTAPIPAMQKALDKAGWKMSDVDVFEVNEAFAVVAMAAQKDLSIPRDVLNVNGGACALGHPIGSSGRAHPDHPDRGPAGRRRQEGPRLAVHRRRRSDGDGGGAGLGRRFAASD